MASSIYVGTSGGLVGLDEETRADFEGSVVDAVARGSNTWWAIVDGHEIWRGEPGSWQHAATVDEHRLSCVQAHDHDALLGTSEARLLRVDLDSEVSFIDEFDSLDERDGWYTPWGGPPDVRSLAHDDKGNLYVNVHVGGVLRSNDNGGTFTPTIDIDSDVHEVVCTNGSLLAATAWGLAVSDDSGASWSFETDGLHATYCRAVAVAADILLVSASVGPHGGRSAVYRRPLIGGRLEKCESGLPQWFGDNIDTGCLAAKGARAAFATSDGRVFLSDDSGATWKQLAADLHPARHVVMV